MPRDIAWIHHPHDLAGGASRLLDGALHLWRIRTDTSGMGLELALSMLGERQRERAERMRHAAHRERYIRAQAGLRLILARYLDTTPRAIRFEPGPAGKPYLPTDTRRLSFNLTTTGDLALVALCTWEGPESEIGVDCELMRPRIDIDGVARRMFAPAVLDTLAATPEPQRREVFYRAWTALEADAKTDGRGLFRARAEGAAPPAIINVRPAPGYMAAVARASLPPVDAWQTWDLDPAGPESGLATAFSDSLP